MSKQVVNRQNRSSRFHLRRLMSGAIVGLLLGSTVAHGAGMCVANPQVAPAEGLPPSLSNAGLSLTFSETFDDQPDMISGKGDRCTTGAEVECSATPSGWTHFYTTDKWHPVADNDSGLHASMEISGADPRGNTGKSLIIWDESWGTRSQWGSDGILAKQFDRNYKGMYAEFYIKFDPGFRWESIENGSGTSAGKVLRLSHFNGDATDSRFQNFQGGSNGPIVFLDVKQWTISSTDIRSRFVTHIRCNPLATNETYKCANYNESSDVKLPTDPNFVESYGDGNWHKVGMWVKMNSGPGINDGELSVWYDDILVKSKTDVPYLGAGGNTNVGWNIAMVGGNFSNVPADDSERFEQPWAIDDIKIYTTNNN